jgi:hypothetical protein
VSILSGSCDVNQQMCGVQDILYTFQAAGALEKAVGLEDAAL